MPTRFHYKKVAPSSYNLEASDILMATDTELNSYISLRKLAPYRSGPDGGEEEKKSSKSKKRLKELRDIIKNRKWGEEINEEREQELRERYGKKIKWSQVDSRTNLDPIDDSPSTSTLPIKSEEVEVKVPVMGGKERRQLIHPDRVQTGPVKRGGKKERERLKKAAALEATTII